MKSPSTSDALLSFIVPKIRWSWRFSPICASEQNRPRNMGTARGKDLFKSDQVNEVEHGGKVLPTAVYLFN